MRGRIKNQPRKKETKISKKNCSNQKLPNSDWTRFWSKYEVEIYKSKISSVAKFHI